MLLPGIARADGRVDIGSLELVPKRPVPPGPVKVAVRPEAWSVGPPGSRGLPGTVSRQSYLGGYQELSVDTPLGSIFVVSVGSAAAWSVGDPVALELGGRGVSFVAA
jgi:iron(III) transport system ATP-binding protein